MIVQIIASGILSGLGVVAVAQGTVLGGDQIRLLIGGATMLLLAAGLIGNVIIGAS